MGACMSSFKFDLDFLEAFLRSAGFHYEDTLGAWNLMGIRSAQPDGNNGIVTVAEQPDRYNDTLLVFGKDTHGTAFFRTYRCTVDPGMYWTKNPEPKRGCAHLLNGQYRFKVGTHNVSKPPAKRFPCLI